MDLVLQQHPRWSNLTIITKRSILDVAAVLDPPLLYTFIKKMFNRKRFIKSWFWHSQNRSIPKIIDIKVKTISLELLLDKFFNVRNNDIFSTLPNIFDGPLLQKQSKQSNILQKSSIGDIWLKYPSNTPLHKRLFI